MKTRAVVATLVAFLGVGCSKQAAETTSAPAPEPTMSRPQSATSRRSSNVITADELSKSAAQNLYNAVQLLRPNWLRSRGPTSLGRGSAGDQLWVYFENTRYGNVQTLQQLTINGIAEMRYYDPAEATNRYGTGHSMGAIVIKHTRQ